MLIVHCMEIKYLSISIVTHLVQKSTLVLLLLIKILTLKILIKVTQPLNLLVTIKESCCNQTVITCHITAYSTTLPIAPARHTNLLISNCWNFVHAAMASLIGLMLQQSFTVTSIWLAGVVRSLLPSTSSTMGQRRGMSSSGSSSMSKQTSFECMRTFFYFDFDFCKLAPRAGFSTFFQMFFVYAQKTKLFPDFARFWEANQPKNEKAVCVRFRLLQKIIGCF